LEKSAIKELKNLDKKIIPKIISAVENLSFEPFPIGVKKLASTEFTYRIRVGDYRIVYTLFRNQLIIEIIKVGHRKDIYKNK